MITAELETNDATTSTEAGKTTDRQRHRTSGDACSELLRATAGDSAARVRDVRHASRVNLIGE